MNNVTIEPTGGQRELMAAEKVKERVRCAILALAAIAGLIGKKTDRLERQGLN